MPSAVWIDEEGRVVRVDEGTYTQKYGAGNLEFGRDDYVPLVRAWAHGEDDVAFTRREMADQMARRTPEQALADAHFRLGVHLQEEGLEEGAAHHWQEAQRLHPESWNYHRQEGSFEPETAGAKWFAKYQTLGDDPYYAPLREADSEQP